MAIQAYWKTFQADKTNKDWGKKKNKTHRKDREMKQDVLPLTPE